MNRVVKVCGAFFVGSVITAVVASVAIDRAREGFQKTELGLSKVGYIKQVIDDEKLAIKIQGKSQNLQLCGITAKPGAKKVLESLVSQNDLVYVVPLESNLAEVFVPTGNGKEEIELASELLLRKKATIDKEEVDVCPNAAVLKFAEQLDEEDLEEFR
ncbi:MAG: hypothetical protein F6K24_28565 [Okeania sp. SIO2D1]|nr:hypothetical protein [Okeania sp. SIO2D1]